MRRSAPLHGGKVVFLDRDGTINREDGYITKAEQIHLYEGTVPALRMLNEMGYRIVIVSNQAGVGKGLLKESELTEINNAMLGMLADSGVSIERLYYCPHHPEAVVPAYKKQCECRKPGTGMIVRAAHELGVDVRGAYMIGDKLSDVELAHNFGGKGILVLTGYGTKELPLINDRPYAPVYIGTDVLDAVNWIKGRH